MEELIQIRYEEDKPTVSGRELHKALGIKTPYHQWFP
ncbi:MAG: antA/AntB antirepressor family protein, partial [Clostridiales bacterium]|nr:antA/AntB antirepressor family protein [Clostridiales bacterium]